MRFALAAPLLFALALLLIPASGLQAGQAGDGEEPPRGVTGKEIQALLQDWGYKAELREDSVGDPLIISAFEGVKFGIFFYTCSEGVCESIQYRAGFGEPGEVSCETINAFNGAYRYLTALLNEEGKLFLKMDWSMTGDAAAELDKSFEVWRTGVINLLRDLTAEE